LGLPLISDFFRFPSRVYSTLVSLTRSGLLRRARLLRVLCKSGRW